VAGAAVPGVEVPPGAPLVAPGAVPVAGGGVGLAGLDAAAGGVVAGAAAGGTAAGACSAAVGGARPRAMPVAARIAARSGRSGRRRRGMGAGYGRSTIMAVASPPPMQIAAQPRRAPRSAMAWSRVTRMRAPEQPMG